MVDKLSTSQQAGRTAQIVLVEDNPADVLLLEKALRHHHIDYELTCYEDGEQAIHAISQQDFAVPDLIILDLNLPKREGFDVLRIVRSRPALVNVPVAILTSSDAARDRHRAELQKIERYIHKPPGLEEFLEQVGQAVQDLLAGRPK